MTQQKQNKKENNNIQIKDFPIVELEVNQIKKDKTNPNVMTLEQMNGLEKSLINYGRLKHIVVDQNNVLIDGEHRLEVERALGTTKVNVIQVQIKDNIDRKIIRETLNKLHGEYDKQKESNELLEIFEAQRLDELAELLGKPKEDLTELMERFHTNTETGSFESQDIEEFDSVETESKCPKCGYEW